MAKSKGGGGGKGNKAAPGVRRAGSEACTTASKEGKKTCSPRKSGKGGGKHY